MAASWVGIFVWLVVAIIATMVAIRGRAWIGPLRRAPVAEGTRCGRCSYLLRGIESMTCPECGEDLREVGMLPPGVGRGVGAGWRVVLWLVFVLVAALIITPMLVATVIPQVQAAGGTRKFTAPGSGAYRQVVLEYSWERWVLPICSTRLTPLKGAVYLTLSMHAGQVIRVEIDPATRKWALTQAPPGTALPQGLTASTFSRMGLEHVFNAMGVPSSYPGVNAEVTEILAAINTLGAGTLVVTPSVNMVSTSGVGGYGGVFTGGSYTQGQSTRTSVVALGVVALVWLAIAGWGTLRIMRRGRLW